MRAVKVRVRRRPAARPGARNAVFQQVCLKMNGFNDVARLVPVSERNVR